MSSKKYAYIKLHRTRVRVWDVRDIQDGICPRCGAGDDQFYPIHVSAQWGLLQDWTTVTLVSKCDKCERKSAAIFSRNQSPRLFDTCIDVLKRSTTVKF